MSLKRLSHWGFHYERRSFLILAVIVLAARNIRGARGDDFCNAKTDFGKIAYLCCLILIIKWCIVREYNIVYARTNQRIWYQGPCLVPMNQGQDFGKRSGEI